MIRLLNESNDNLKLYDIIKYAEFDWYIIGIDNETVTLLMKDSNYKYIQFDEKSNNYSNSKIRNFLINAANHLERRGATPIPTNLPDVGVTDKLWLLSKEEAEKLPERIRELRSKYRRLSYWLRSPGDSEHEACAVNEYGHIQGWWNVDEVLFYEYRGDEEKGLGKRDVGFGRVRPAMKVNISELVDEINNPPVLALYDTVQYAGYKWYVIRISPSHEITLLMTGRSCYGLKSKFCENKDETPDYKTSIIREYLIKKILPTLESNGAKLIPTNLSDVGVTDKIWLLSKDEAHEIRYGYRKYYRDWALRTVLDNSGFYVDKIGTIYRRKTDMSKEFGVRPAIKVKEEDLQNSLE